MIFWLHYSSHALKRGRGCDQHGLEGKRTQFSVQKDPVRLPTLMFHSLKVSNGLERLQIRRIFAGKIIIPEKATDIED